MIKEVAELVKEIRSVPIQKALRNGWKPDIISALRYFGNQLVEMDRELANDLVLDLLGKVSTREQVIIFESAFIKLATDFNSGVEVEVTSLEEVEDELTRALRAQGNDTIDTAISLGWKGDLDKAEKLCLDHLTDQ